MFSATDRTYYGLPGLASDTITVRDKLRQRINLYSMKEERTIEPETFCHLVSSTLYERRCVCRPVVRVAASSAFEEPTPARFERRRMLTVSPSQVWAVLRRAGDCRCVPSCNTRLLRRMSLTFLAPQG